MERILNGYDLAVDTVRSCLQLDESVALTADTYLMGNFAEFNSLTITTMIAEIEDTVGCTIEDDEISAEIFETVGSLGDFIQEKLD